MYLTFTKKNIVIVYIQSRIERREPYVNTVLLYYCLIYSRYNGYPILQIIRVNSSQALPVTVDRLKVNI